MTIESVLATAEQLRAEYSTELTPVLENSPVSDYITALDNAESTGNYYFVPVSVIQQSEQIKQQHGSEVLESYHKLVLVSLIASFRCRSSHLSLSEIHLSELANFFSMVIREVMSNNYNYFINGNDRFAKNMAVCRLKMLPCGPMLADIQHGGIGRRNLIQRPYRDLLKRLRFLLFKAGSLQNFIELHMDSRLITKFNPEGMRNTYIRAAELLEKDPEKKGVIASGSWLLDPGLEHISPELCHLRELPEHNGALLIPCASSEYAARDATRFSPVRNALFEQGRYVPKEHMWVWHRDDLLAWANRQNC